MNRIQRLRWAWKLKPNDFIGVIRVKDEVWDKGEKALLDTFAYEMRAVNQDWLKGAREHWRRLHGVK